MRSRGWYWPVGLAALLVGSAGANVALLVITSRDASFAVEALHNARASRVLTAALEPRGPDYAAAMPLARPGFWEFRVRVTRGPDVFTATLMRDVPEAR